MQKRKNMWRRVVSVLCLLAFAVGFCPLGGEMPARAEAVEVVLPDAFVGEAYEADLMNRNLPGTPALELKQGSGLPQGLTLSYDGKITGMPTEPGSYALDVVITSDALRIETRYLLEIHPFEIVTRWLMPVRVGEPYADAVRVRGNGLVRFMLAEGTLPEGLSLNEDTGEITGTVSSWNEDVSFTVAVAMGETVRTVAYTMTAADRPVQIVGMDELRQQAAGRPFTFRLGMQGGSGSYGYRVTGSGLQDMRIVQDGATLTFSTAGAPAQTMTLCVEVWDAEDPTNTAIVEAKIPVLDAIAVTGVNPAAETTVGQSVSWQIQTRGGSAAKGYEIVQGVLPAGLTLHGDTGIIDGVPTEAGYFTVCVRVYDMSAVQGLDCYAMITGHVADQMALLPETIPGGSLRTELTVQGGVAPYRVDILSADPTVLGAVIEPGADDLHFTLAVDAGSSGALSLQVTDATGAVCTRDYILSAQAPIAITVSDPPAAAVNRYYDAQLTVMVTAEEDITLEAQGLPYGLVMDASGRITGTPESIGSSLVTLTARGNTTGTVAQAAFTVTVTGNPDILQLEAVSGINRIGWDEGSGQWLLEMAQDAGEAVFHVGLADVTATVSVPAPASVDGKKVTVPMGDSMTLSVPLTVTTADGYTRIHSVLAVKQATTLQILGVPEEVELGESFTLTVEAQPAGAWLGPITWEYDAASLRHTGSNPAVFDTLKEGSFTITARTRDALGKNISTDVRVTVMDPDADDPTPRPTSRATVRPTSRPTATPKPAATSRPALNENAAPESTPEPTPTPTPVPDEQAALTPTAEPTPTPIPTPTAAPTPVPEKDGERDLPVWVWPLIAALVILIPSVVVVVIKDIQSRRNALIIDETEGSITFGVDGASGDPDDRNSDNT